MSKNLTAIAVGALVLAATAISPALGGPSLNQMVKDEVAKVAAKKKRGPRGPTGPTGPAGAAGAQGLQGIPGTARAYARVGATVAATPAPATLSKGISSPVAHPSDGIYCVTAPGIDPATTPAVVSADNAGTAAPQGNATAQYASTGSGCPAGTFGVITYRLPAGSPPPDNYDFSDTVSFTIVIP